MNIIGIISTLFIGIFKAIAYIIYYVLKILKTVAVWVFLEIIKALIFIAVVMGILLLLYEAY